MQWRILYFIDFLNITSSYLPTFELWWFMPTKQILQVRCSNHWMILVFWSVRPTWSFHKQKGSICQGSFWQFIITWWITYAVMNNRAAAELWGWPNRQSATAKRDKKPQIETLPVHWKGLDAVMPWQTLNNKWTVCHMQKYLLSVCVHTNVIQ